MKAILIVHFGSPKNRSELKALINDLFDDPSIDFFNKFYFRLVSGFIKRAALRSAAKKYESINFDPTYAAQLKKFADKLGACLNGIPVFIASQYGPPSIEETFEKMDEAGIDRAFVIPLYPHSSLEMYDSIVSKCQKLQSGFFGNIHLEWAPPFFDHQMFVKAWAGSVKNELNNFSSDENKLPHLLFCAHANLLKNSEVSGAPSDYERQVVMSAELIKQEVGFKGQISVAYQSAERFGRWTGPSLEDEIKKLAEKKVEDCIIVPLSFLFDNIETLVDIDNIAVPFAKRLGITKIYRAIPPGSSREFVYLIKDVIEHNQRIG